MTTSLVILGAPRTKKTSNVLATAGGRHVVLPSKAWRDWVKRADIQWPDVGQHEAWFANGPILCEVNCCALFYREALRGDAAGYYQGLADLLESRGIVENDKQIVSWDGSRLLKDPVRPRVELQLQPLLDYGESVGAEA